MSTNWSKVLDKDPPLPGSSDPEKSILDYLSYLKEQLNFFLSNYRKRLDEAVGVTIKDGKIIASYKGDVEIYRSTYDADPDPTTNPDLLELRSIIRAETTPTAAQLKKYDLNGDGVLRMSDLVKLRNLILAGSNKVNWRSVTIDPTDETAITIQSGEYENVPKFTTVIKADRVTVTYDSLDDDGNPVTKTTTISGDITTTGEIFQWNGGKLHQYDKNGKRRTYLEYGDFYLYDSSETQKFHVDSNGRVYPLGSSNYINDFVISEGSTSGWSWRKWNSGIWEGWKTVSITLATSAWSAWGGIFQSTKVARQSLPVTLTAGHYEYVTSHSTEDWSSWAIVVDAPTTSQSGSYMFCRGAKPSDSATFTLDYYVKGTVA